MHHRAIAAAVAAAMLGGLAAPAAADHKTPPFDPRDPAYAPFVSGEKRSGYTYAEPETRAMQEDDFQNPAFLWMEQAQSAWTVAEGEAGKSCAACHGKAEESMKGVGAGYPRFDAKAGKVVNVEQRINMCRTEQMKAPAWKYESAELLGMTTFVKYQSRGTPIKVSIDGPAAPFFEKGKAFYYERRGLNDLACKHCHEDNPGNHIRTELLSQGMSNGFPTYRLKWQKLGSLHKRLAGCNEEIRAQPYPLGSDEYTNLELYLAWRAEGLRVETPSVRK